MEPKGRRKPRSATTNSAAIRTYGTNERMPVFTPTAADVYYNLHVNGAAGLLLISTRKPTRDANLHGGIGYVSSACCWTRLSLGRGLSTFSEMRLIASSYRLAD